MSFVEDFHLAISDGVVRYFHRRSILMRCPGAPVRITRDATIATTFHFDCGAQFDEEVDDLIEQSGVRFVVANEFGDQIRGWQFIGCESLYSDFNYYNVPPGFVSNASDPGMLTLDRDRLLALEPELAGFRGLRLRIQDRRRGSSKYLGSFETVADHLWRGDSRAAMVLAVAPRVLVAAFADDFDAIVVLEFPRSFATTFSLEPGTRLLNCNTFSQTEETIAADITLGPKWDHRMTDFYPIIGQFLSGDTDRLEQRMAGISSSEWERVRQLGEEWLVRFHNGEIQPRQGVALWPTGPIEKMRRLKASFGRRVLATAVDLSLITLITLLLWLLFGLGDEILFFWQNPKNPVARAAFREHKETFRTVAALVYFSYATLALVIPWQATFGKRLLGLRVVSRESFGRIPFLKALRRSALFLFSGLCGALGHLAVLWSHSGQTWHDDRCGTCVIDDRSRSRFSDRLIALSMVVSIVLMGFGVLWKLETADVIAPVALPNAIPLPGRPAVEPITVPPRILQADGELLVDAVAFPELGVELKPPKEFHLAETFVGFQHEATQSKIEVSIKQASFHEVMAEYGSDRLRKNGSALRESRSRTIFGRSSGEVRFEQTTPGGVLVIWVSVLGAEDRCAVATAFAPKNREDELAPFFKASVATLRWLPKSAQLSVPPQGDPSKASNPDTSAQPDPVVAPETATEPAQKRGRTIRRKNAEASPDASK